MMDFELVRSELGFGLAVVILEKTLNPEFFNEFTLFKKFYALNLMIGRTFLFI